MKQTKIILSILATMFMVGMLFFGMAAALSPLDNTDGGADPDGDFLTNVQEYAAGTDPNNPDTDNDGMPDGWEEQFNLDPNNPADADYDDDWDNEEEFAVGLYTEKPYTNYYEYWRFWFTDEHGVDQYMHTQPNNGDSDADGVWDPDDPFPLGNDNDGVGGGGGGGSGGQGGDAPVPPDPTDPDGDNVKTEDEYMIGTDPQNPDTDGDGLGDGQELELGLDPNDWDTDNDLLMDGSEIGGGGGSTDGHLIDTDNDGFNPVDPNIEIKRMPVFGLKTSIELFDRPVDLSFKRIPNGQDSDNDGISDMEEIRLDLDPYDWDTDNDLMSDGFELGTEWCSTDPYLKDSDNDGLEDSWEENDNDGMINIEEQNCIWLGGLNPNSNDTDNDDIADEMELQLIEPGPMNKNKDVYHLTQVYKGSDSDGADNRNASGRDGRPGIAWTDDDGDGEANSPTNFYDTDGDGEFTLFRLNYRGEYIMEGLAPDDPDWKRIDVDIPTTDTVDNDAEDGIPLIIGTEHWPDGEAKALADGKDNNANGIADDGIDEKDEVAYSKDGYPGRPSHDDDGDSKDSDEDDYCDGQEVRDGSNPNDAWDIPMHQGPDGKWVKDPVEPSTNWIDEPDEYGAPGSDDYTDDSADDDGVVDNAFIRYDRWNPDQDIAIVGSAVDQLFEGNLRWMVPYFWRSHEYFMEGKGGLPFNSTCIPFISWNPRLLLWCGENWNQTMVAPLFYKGKPYRWNMYDIDPRLDDTDTGVAGLIGVSCFDNMEDDWDPRPTIPDDRLDTNMALHYIKNTETGEVFYPEFGEAGAQGPIWWGSNFAFMPPAPDMRHDQYGFPFTLPAMTLTKGTKYEISIFMGFEYCEPESKPIRAGWFNDYNITVGWNNMSYWDDQLHYTVDDDYDGDDLPWGADLDPMIGCWMYDPDSVTNGRGHLPDTSIRRQDLVADNVPADLRLEPYDVTVPYYDPIFDTTFPACPWPDNYNNRNGLEVAFLNMSVDGQAHWSNMTFYEMKMFFYIPDGCPAGFLAFDIGSETNENIRITAGPWEIWDTLVGYRYNAFYN